MHELKSTQKMNKFTSDTRQQVMHKNRTGVFRSAIYLYPRSEIFEIFFRALDLSLFTLGTLSVGESLAGTRTNSQLFEFCWFIGSF